MKRIVFALAAIAFVFLITPGCSKPGVEETEEEVKDLRKELVSGCTFYIRDSRAGGEPLSWGSGQVHKERIRPQKAFIFIRETEKGLAHIDVKYEFWIKPGVRECYCYFSFDNVPVKAEAKFIQFNTEGISGTCVVYDILTVHEEELFSEVEQVSFKGRLGLSDWNSRLSIVGTINGYSFELDLLSVTESEDKFTPEAFGGELVLDTDFQEMELKNETSSNVRFSLYGCTIVNPTGFVQSIDIALAPGESQMIPALFMPSEVSVSITFGGRKKVVLNGVGEILSSDCMILDSYEQKWYMWAHPSGRLQPRRFEHLYFSIKEP